MGKVLQDFKAVMANVFFGEIRVKQNAQAAVCSQKLMYNTTSMTRSLVWQSNKLKRSVSKQRINKSSNSNVTANRLYYDASRNQQR